MAIGEVLVKYFATEQSTTLSQKIFPNQIEAQEFASSLGIRYYTSYVLDGMEDTPEPQPETTTEE